MDKSELESRKLLELKELANTLGIEGAEKMKKAELIDVGAFDFCGALA